MGFLSYVKGAKSAEVSGITRALTGNIIVITNDGVTIVTLLPGILRKRAFLVGGTLAGPGINRSLLGILVRRAFLGS